jgi:mannose-6-phosphate isomerase-like protein (cupin superfamily)
MKNNFFYAICSALLALLPWQSNAQMNRVLNDTTFVKATEITLQPGEKTDMHTHPAHFFYALTDGKLLVHYKDGKTQTYDLKQGMSGVSGPERWHTTENPGTTPVKFLIVELKDRPYKEKMK